MGCSFNLRHQVSELEDARLTVLPEYLDGAVIFFDHFAPSLIKNPDHSVAYLQSFGFLRLHLMENAPVTLYRAVFVLESPDAGVPFLSKCPGHSVSLIALSPIQNQGPAVPVLFPFSVHAAQGGGDWSLDALLAAYARAPGTRHRRSDARTGAATLVDFLRTTSPVETFN
jgi:hypothetical protein